MSKRPGYIRLYETGELFERIKKLNTILSDCALCPRDCRSNRLRGHRGYCRTGDLPMVSSAHPHFGEEPPLTGTGGSGTIFMTHCNLECVYCQNHEVSQGGDGETVTEEELSAMMVSLQKKGCHNINFVTPTHQVPQIVESLPKAIENGLDIPLVYNCAGYEEVPTLKLIEGIFDIYMPDIKYGDDKTAERLSSARRYFEVAKAAVREMHRQVGDLTVDERGVAQKGLIIRHLVLPNGAAGTRKVMRFIAKEISPETYVNLMRQYQPCFMAGKHADISRPVTDAEFAQALEAARAEGLKRIEGA